MNNEEGLTIEDFYSILERNDSFPIQTIFITPLVLRTSILVEDYSEISK